LQGITEEGGGDEGDRTPNSHLTHDYHYNRMILLGKKVIRPRR